MLCVLVLLSSGGWEKIKLELAHAPHFHVFRRTSCVNLTKLCGYLFSCRGRTFGKLGCGHSLGVGVVGGDEGGSGLDVLFSNTWHVKLVAPNS